MIVGDDASGVNSGTRRCERRDMRMLSTIRHRWGRSLCGCLVAVLITASWSIHSANDVSLQAKFDKWSLTITEIETSETFDFDLIRSQKKTIFQTISEIEQTREELDAQIEQTDLRIRALRLANDAAVPNTSALTPEIAKFEARKEALSLSKERIDLLHKSASEIDAQLTVEFKAKFRRSLATRLPLPYLASTYVPAGESFAAALSVARREVAENFAAVSEVRRQDARPSRGPVVLLGVVVIILLGFVGLRRVVKRVDPSGQSMSTVLWRAAGRILLTGLIPFAILNSLPSVFGTSLSGYSEGFVNIFDAVTTELGRLILLVAVCWTVLSPAAPRWRFLNVTTQSAWTLTIAIALIGCVRFINHVLEAAVYENYLLRFDIASEDALTSVALSAFAVLYAVLVLIVFDPRRWTSAPETGDRQFPLDVWGAFAENRAFRFLMHASRLLMLIALAGIALGYVFLGYYLTYVVIFVAAVAVVAVVAVTVLHALVDRTVSYLSLKRRQTGDDQERGLVGQITALLLIIAGDSIIVLIALRTIAPVVGIPQQDFTKTVLDSFSGFTIAGVKVSPSTIIVAIGIVVIGFLITRLVQRLLDDRLLSHAQIDIGVRNSIKAGLGYAGIAATILLAISSVGFDLSQIALIAGALSVGIGFGLQGVVNNFVSGLILLIERPIKEGDWISVGTYQGIVKQINVRATEIETFQRAALIIPNSEILSANLINWTHRNLAGRAEVVVGVDYDSDPDEVVETIKSCFDDHQKVRAYPEPLVICLEFGDSAIVYRGQGIVNDVNDKIFVESDIRMTLLRRFRDKSIHIPFPQRDLHIVDFKGSQDALEIQATPSGTAEPATPGG